MTPEAEEIEEESFRIIEEKLKGISPPEKEVVKRVIHTTADFDFKDLVIFKAHAIETGVTAVKAGRDIITDVNMVKAGINTRLLSRFGGTVKCFIQDDKVKKASKREGTTRARTAFRLYKDELVDNVVVIGNAPTAVFELCTLLEEGIRPAMVVAAPVGFVGAREAKERILEYNVPTIAIRGEKGGSTVAVAITNAILKLASEEE